MSARDKPLDEHLTVWLGVNDDGLQVGIAFANVAALTWINSQPYVPAEDRSAFRQDRRLRIWLSKDVRIVLHEAEGIDFQRRWALYHETIAQPQLYIEGKKP